MSINLSVPRDEHEMKPRISVVGVGGAGGNAVNNMIRSNLVGCEFLICNTDAQAMMQNLAERRIQLGVSVTRGLGAGSRPDVGRAAAEEALDEIMQALNGSNMVFITAGMGGGTGTGAGPVIARAAREAGILTVGVVTKPFQFEGAQRMRIAEAFKMADDVLYSGVRGVTDLMVMPGLINLDFADIRAIMGEMGKAMMGTGEAEGDRRAIDAAEAAISNPLLEDVSMKGARGVLINITGGPDMTLFEVDEAANRIREEVDPEANIIFGSTFDDKIAGRMRISVVATGIDAEALAQAKPVIQLVSDRGRTNGAAPVEPAAAPLPAVAAEPAPAQADAIETAAVKGGAFIAPRPVEVAGARPLAVARPAVAPDAFAAAAMENGGRVPQKPKGRGPSLFERVTGAARRSVGEAEPASRAAPMPAAQQRLGALDPADRLRPSKEEDVLDIPAFLRRQAN